MSLHLPGRRARARLARRREARRALRQPSGFRIAIADAISQLDPAAWDEVVADESWFFSREYLAMLERVPPSVVEPRYALVCDAQGPVAAVVLQWAEVDGTRLRPLPAGAGGDDELNPLRRLVDKLSRPARRAFATRLRERVLVCGNLLTYGQHAVAVAPDVDPDGVWPAVAEVLYRIRRAEKLAGQAGFVLIKDIPLAANAGVARLADVGYKGIETEPNMVLALDAAWKTHADYLGGLTSKYRSAVRNQILQPIEQAGLAVRAYVPSGALARRTHELYLGVHRNAALRPFTLHEDYFAELAAAAGARARFAGLFDVPDDTPEALLGFIVTLADVDEALAYHIGFVQDDPRGLPLYLRLLHASIADAIALEATALSFGRTALEPKARLGARPQDMQVWLRHRQPVFNRIVRQLTGFAHHAEAPETHPFKKS
ncbi:MAG TPA: GNAT family N-acetyltransferase [Burkholderiaceae bacterium]